MARVTVQVVDVSTGAGIPWVNVRLDGFFGSTNSTGVVSFEVPPGRYTLIVRTAAYSPYTETFSVTADTTKVVYLTRAAI